MFAPGDRVVCVDNDWSEARTEGLGFLSRSFTSLILRLAGDCPLELGREYSIYHSMPKGTAFSQGGRTIRVQTDSVGVGIPNPLMQWVGKVFMIRLPTVDVCPEQWFAKVEKRETGVEESLKAFRDMAARTPVGVEVDA